MGYKEYDDNKTEINTTICCTNEECEKDFTKI